jgi:hypothetical protein
MIERIAQLNLVEDEYMKNSPKDRRTKDQVRP